MAASSSSSSSKMSEDDKKTVLFHEMGLDDRILKAVSKLKWLEPTLIQERAIPLALEGKDILARARTGSGKTAAFVIPMIQHILRKKQLSRIQETKAVVLAPSRELCRQTFTCILNLTTYCSREVRAVDISGQADLASQRPLLISKPDIIVGTPSRLMAHMQAGNIDLKTSLEVLALDEADLMFSFGYKDDIHKVLEKLPDIYQAFLMSATLTDNVNILKNMVLHNPVILKLEEPLLPSSKQLTQYHIKCEEEDKFVVICAMFKLHLIRGKTIIFMNTVDRCYKMKLFLEQFGITSAILNSELPVSSRCHIVSQFNEGRYDIVIASDEASLDEPSTEPTDNVKKKRKVDSEYGVSRGIDFHFISNIINFDFPVKVKSYIHRVGRTARGNNEGSALSFISSKDLPLMEAVEKFIAETSNENGMIFKPYQFRMDEIEGFRYRSRDALRAVTRIAVREARLKEIRKEILNSKQLKSYFDDNPRDLQLLRHDRALHTIRIHQHLKDVPDYNVPETLKKMTRQQRKRVRPRKHYLTAAKKVSKGEAKFIKKKSDPLRSFECPGSKKNKKGHKKK